MLENPAYKMERWFCVQCFLWMRMLKLKKGSVLAPCGDRFDPYLVNFRQDASWRCWRFIEFLLGRTEAKHPFVLRKVIGWRIDLCLRSFRFVHPLLVVMLINLCK